MRSHGEKYYIRISVHRMKKRLSLAVPSVHVQTRPNQVTPPL